MGILNDPDVCDPFQSLDSSMSDGYGMSLLAEKNDSGLKLIFLVHYILLYCESPTAWDAATRCPTADGVTYLCWKDDDAETTLSLRQENDVDGRRIRSHGGDDLRRCRRAIGTGNDCRLSISQSPCGQIAVNESDRGP
jgi:hypothetical protein